MHLHERIFDAMEADAEAIAMRTIMAIGAEVEEDYLAATADDNVHANTVHYRLRRVQELTGRDPRRFADLVELTTALRMIASNG